jgi:hypothetical protein
MDTEYLDQLAEQLKAEKSPACRRAINRILADTKKRCEEGKYDTPMEAEATFRRLVEETRACQKTRAAEAM